MEKIEGQKVSENIYLCPDGKYRWVYELNMLANPVILFTIWKIFGIILLALLVFSFLLEVSDGNAGLWVQNFLLTPMILIIPGILLVLTLIAYLVVAAVYGFKYVVLFEMDEEGVVHNQMPRQFKKAEGMAWLSVMAGVIAGDYTTVGAGIMAGSKTSSRTRFSDVRSIVRQEKYHTIRVNEIMEKNQIYADDADYDFVWSYITNRCPEAKIK